MLSYIVFNTTYAKGRNYMSYKIIVDSCCDFPIDFKVDERIQKVPLFLELDGVTTVDDETFDQADFIKRVHESKSFPKSSCPSPQSYMEAFKSEAENIYVVTLSAALSGSHNSALIGKSMYEEEIGPKNIHVFDSCSASVGEASIALKCIELEEKGLSFDEIVKETEEFSKEMKTYFVLDTLETLRKNGRLTGLQAIVTSVLNIKPIMGATDEGTICKLDQARGMEKALAKMVKLIVDATKNAEDKVLAISHCNCLERAHYLKEELTKAAKFKNITIADMAGVSTMYANDGGIIVTV